MYYSYDAYNEAFNSGNGEVVVLGVPHMNSNLASKFTSML
ncbi:hypothetical protein IC007_0469 [Sulfuracidifex tepidarius]|uniref:Uncharacterized protein n=1 Tax=Sulfuracidifex tepidarius TaxID=1294262 RepID=A0A510E0F8_9CREN|nr:hypothetical protein IC007_0469 [Sulfuracidifex tepidarius]